MSLKKILLEFQNKNYLYHFTSITSAKEIFKTDALLGFGSWSIRDLAGRKYGNRNKNGISFTRRRNFPVFFRNYISGVFGKINLVGLAFDRRSLRHKYKIHTFDVHGANNEKDDKELSEEIIFGNINNVKSLIEFVYVPREYIEKNVDDIGTYLYEFIPFYLEYMDTIDFKVFEKSNFRDLNKDNIDYDPLAPSDILQTVYDQIFQ